MPGREIEARIGVNNGGNLPSGEVVRSMRRLEQKVGLSLLPLVGIVRIVGIWRKPGRIEISLLIFVKVAGRK